jgi:hypothetical protein
MELAHWLMIGGAFLVFVGFIGAALQKNARVGGEPVSAKQARETGEQPEFLPNCLPPKMS